MILLKPLNKKMDFNIGQYKVKFNNEFKRKIEIKESPTSQFDILEIGSIEYSGVSIVLALRKDTEDKAIVPFIAETKMPNGEFIIMFDYECYTNFNQQIYRCYLAHELGHIISELNKNVFPYQTFEEKEKEVLEKKLNANENFADIEALKLIGNKNTYIKSLEYLIERISDFNDEEDLRLKLTMTESIKLRIRALK